MKYFTIYNSDTQDFEVITVESIGSGGGGSTTYIGDTPPLDAPEGTLWVDTSDNTVDESLNDADTESY